MKKSFFQPSLKGMIRFYLNMEHGEVYGKFVLTVCICSILYFCKKFVDCKKTDSASLFTRGIIKNTVFAVVLIFAKAQNEKSKLFS